MTVVKLLMRRLPSEPTAPRVEPEPAAVDAKSAVTSAPSRLRLPAPMAAKVTSAVKAARSGGREPTIADVQRAVNVSDEMAGQILSALTAVNAHPAGKS